MSNHIIMSIDPEGASQLESSPAPQFDESGFPDGWKGMALEDSGVFIFMFEIAEGAVEFPVHASEDEWLAYVVSGSGMLYAGTAAMDRTEGVAYSAGDFITFEGNTPHGWKAAGEPSRILFAKKA